MNKLSKLTALLLAIVLALSVPLQAMAESVIDTETKYEAEVSRLLELLYNNMMTGKEYQELLDMTETMLRQDIVNFLERVDAENVADLEAYDARIQELFELYMEDRIREFAYPYTNVGSFLNYTTSASETPAMFSALSRAVTNSNATNTTNGMTTTKSVNWDQENNKGTITIEAFATGATTLTQTIKCPPLDIVVVIDQSSSMRNNNMPGVKYNSAGTIKDSTDKNKTYYIKDDEGRRWIAVTYCTNCSAWTYGCEHLAQNETKGTVVPNGTQIYQQQAGQVTRRDALIPAVQKFVDTVIEKAEGDPATTADNTNHRIAFVGYDANTRIYTDVNKTGNAAGAFISLQDAAGQTKAENIVYNTGTGNTSLWYNNGSGTGQDYAVAAARDILNNQSNKLDNVDTDGNGKIDDYEKRAKVVILFTDGEPYRSGTNRRTIANNAIAAAKQIKDTGATVYTIGVLDGADPDEPLNNNIGTNDNVPVNKFLHYVSSNYPGATSLSSDHTKCDVPGHYYLAATSAEELDSIFVQIAGNIESSGGTSVTLTEESVVMDVLTDTFELPAGASSIRVYTADINSATTTPYTFKARKLVYGKDGNQNITTGAFVPTISEDGKSISVSGFNFSDYWCGTIKGTDGKTTTRTEGKKLIIEIDIEPVDGFLGGNNVETNVFDKSGIFADDEATTPVMPLPDPDNVDVAIWEITVEGKHQHIYLGNEADVNELLQSFSLKYTKKGDPEQSYTVNGIRNEYATLKFTLEAESGKQMVYTILPGDKAGTWTYVSATGDPIANFDVTPFLTEHTTYNISYEVIPTVETTFKRTTGSLDAQVHVYKPTFTFKDTSEKYLSEEMEKDYYNKNNFVSESWSHTYNNETSETADDVTVTIHVENGTPVSYEISGAVEKGETTWNGTDPIVVTNDYSITMTGTKPTVAFEYAPEQSAWITGNKVTNTKCVPVNVTKVTLSSVNTHKELSLDQEGAVGTKTYTTTTVYTETNGDGSYTVKKGETTSEMKPVIGTHIKTKRIAEACTTCVTTAGAVTNTDIHAASPVEFVVHIYDVHGKLVITKTVENTTGFTPLQSAFTFTVTLTDANGAALEGPFDYTGTGVEPGTIANGGTITLGDGQSITIADLPANTRYTVTEADGHGFTTTSVNAEGSIEAGKSATAAFTNTYHTGSLTVSKTVEGNNAANQYPKTFRFSLTLEDANGTAATPAIKIGSETVAPVNGVYTFELTAGSNAVITGIPYGITYTVTELLTVGDVVYSDYYTTAVKVNNGEQAASSVASDTIAADKAAQTVDFTNTAKTKTLTINKTGMVNGESAIVNVTVNVAGETNARNYRLVFNANNTVATIVGLPIGSTYSVTEENGWSWRYKDGTITYVDEAVAGTHQIDVVDTLNVVNIANSPNTDKWMHDESAVENNVTEGVQKGNGDKGSINNQ